uniref:Uncharacterized protein n=1 Tax=Timspurckia oligopyrenoides TaxID=708627 RepID=A0A7S0ZIJ9_9RHOD
MEGVPVHLLVPDSLQDEKAMQFDVIDRLLSVSNENQFNDKDIGVEDSEGIVEGFTEAKHLEEKEVNEGLRKRRKHRDVESSSEKRQKIQESRKKWKEHAPEQSFAFGFL